MLRSDEDYSKSDLLQVQLAARAGSKAAQAELVRRLGAASTSPKK